MMTQRTDDQTIQSIARSSVIDSSVPRSARPLEKPPLAPVIDDAILRDGRQSRVRDGDVDEVQFRVRVRVAGERKDAPAGERACGKLIVDVLTVPRSVDLDGNLAAGGGGEPTRPFV